MKKDTPGIMQFPEEIHIKDIAGKKFRIKIYGQKSLEDQLAVITHYLHHHSAPEGKIYKKDAIAEIRNLLQAAYPQKIPFSTDYSVIFTTYPSPLR